MDFTKNELDLLHTLVIDYLRDYHDDTEAQIILEKIKAEKQLIEVNDQFEEDLNKAINGE